MGDQCGKTEGNCNSFATTSNTSTSTKFYSTNIILSISRTCLSEDLAHRLLQQDLKTGWAIFENDNVDNLFAIIENDCPGKHFFCCPVTGQRQKILQYIWHCWESLNIDKLTNSNNDFHENHWRSEVDHHHHQYHHLQNSNMLSAILCLIKEIDAPSLEVVELAARLSFSTEMNIFESFKCTSKKTGHTMKKRSSSSDELSCRCRMEELDD